MSNCTKRYREFPKSQKRRAKKPFLFAFITTTQIYRIKVEPRYYQAQEPPLSTRVLFVRIGPADWTLSGNNVKRQKLNQVHIRSLLCLLTSGCKADLQRPGSNLVIFLGCLLVSATSSVSLGMMPAGFSLRPGKTVGTQSTSSGFELLEPVIK